jgi:hypothetical protein
MADTPGSTLALVAGEQVLAQVGQVLEDRVLAGVGVPCRDRVIQAAFGEHQRDLRDVLLNRLPMTWPHFRLSYDLT